MSYVRFGSISLARRSRRPLQSRTRVLRRVGAFWRGSGRAGRRVCKWGSGRYPVVTVSRSASTLIARRANGSAGKRVTSSRRSGNAPHAVLLRISPFGLGAVGSEVWGKAGPPRSNAVPGAATAIPGARPRAAIRAWARIGGSRSASVASGSGRRCAILPACRLSLRRCRWTSGGRTRTGSTARRALPRRAQPGSAGRDSRIPAVARRRVGARGHPARHTAGRRDGPGRQEELRSDGQARLPWPQAARVTHHPDSRTHRTDRTSPCPQRARLLPHRSRSGPRSSTRRVASGAMRVQPHASPRTRCRCRSRARTSSPSTWGAIRARAALFR